MSEIWSNGNFIENSNKLETSGLIQGKEVKNDGTKMLGKSGSSSTLSIILGNSQETADCGSQLLRKGVGREDISEKLCNMWVRKIKEYWKKKHDKWGKPRAEKRFSELWQMHGIRHISSRWIVKPERDTLGHKTRIHWMSFLTDHVLSIFTSCVTCTKEHTFFFHHIVKKALVFLAPNHQNSYPKNLFFADSFISIKFEDNGVASWEKTKTTKVPLQHYTNIPFSKEAKGTKSVVEHAKPRGSLRWRKRIGHLFQLIRWKRSSKTNACHVGSKVEGVKVMRKGWIRTLTKRKTKE